jgi:hypothetical protein
MNDELDIEIWEQIQKHPLSYSSADDLRTRVENLPIGGPHWKSCPIKLDDAPKEDIHLLYRDINECVAHLFANPNFQDMAFEPAKEFFNNERIINEMHTADMWFETQVCQDLAHHITILMLLIVFLGRD